MSEDTGAESATAPAVAPEAPAEPVSSAPLSEADQLTADLMMLNEGMQELQKKHNLVLLAEPFIDLANGGGISAKIVASRPTQLDGSDSLANEKTAA